MNVKQRQAIYRSVQMILAQMACIIPLYSADMVYAAQKYVKNLRLHPSGFYYGLRNVKLEKAVTRTSRKQTWINPKAVRTKCQDGRGSQNGQSQRDCPYTSYTILRSTCFIQAFKGARKPARDDRFSAGRSRAVKPHPETGDGPPGGPDSEGHPQRCGHEFKYLAISGAKDPLHPSHPVRREHPGFPDAAADPGHGRRADHGDGRHGHQRNGGEPQDLFRPGSADPHPISSLGPES